MNGDERHTGRAWSALQQVVGDVDAPLAFCSESGLLELAAPACLQQLERLGLHLDQPLQLPDSLWDALSLAPVGQAVEWRASAAPELILECTRYRVRGGGFMVWLRDVCDPQATMPAPLQQLRHESSARLIASIARDVCGSVSAIVYNSDFLDARGADVSRESVGEVVHEIADASRRLQLTVDGLLDHAGLGPAIAVPVSLQNVLDRAQGLLRSFYRDGAQRLRVELDTGADWVRGNPLVVEQIFVNLLLVFVERANARRSVQVRSALDAGGSMVSVQFQSVSEVRELPSPHVTSSAARSAARVALLEARSATDSQGGQLRIDEHEPPSFTVSLPRSEGPR